MYPNITPIVVVGAGGYMGLSYLKNLISLGIPTGHIVGVEPSDERRREVTALRVWAPHSVEKSADYVPKTAIVCAPSHMHRTIFDECARIGIQNILTEKPLVLHAQELEGLHELSVRLYVGYLINFSPTVQALTKFMRERGLQCRGVIAHWGNNWLAKDRPIGPNLQEELGHPLTLGLHLIGSDRIRNVGTASIALSHVPYMRPEMKLDPFTVDPNDTSLGMFCAETNEGSVVPISILSSFSLFEQRRVVDVSLVKQGESIPWYRACLEFDTFEARGRTDCLRIVEVRTQRPAIEPVIVRPNKLLLQLQAALEAFDGKAPDARLVTLDQAAQVVELLEGAHR